MGKFLNIFLHPITVEQIGFYFEFSFWNNYFALGRTFQNFEKSLKIGVPSTPTVNIYLLYILSSK